MNAYERIRTITEKGKRKCNSVSRFK